VDAKKINSLGHISQRTKALTDRRKTYGKTNFGRPDDTLLSDHL
jgi:hypothetical protein